MLHFVSDLQKSQVTKSLRSPHRVLEGLHVDSLKSPLIMRIISGVPNDSLWTPYKVFGESLGSPWGLPSNVWLSVTTSLTISSISHLSKCPASAQCQVRHLPDNH